MAPQPHKVVVAFRDTVDPTWTWYFDETFLLSGWRCHFGDDCPGAEGHPEVGCCDTGAYLANGHERALVSSRATQLTAEEWQLRDEGYENGWTEDLEDGSVKTRVVEVDGVSACVFANRPGHPGGTGCALHQAALRRGEDPTDWKPPICWTVPLQVEVDEGLRTRYVRSFGHFQDWGGGEHEPLQWWCVDDARIYDSPEPLYRTMERELRVIAGDGVYALLAEHLDAKLAEQGGEPGRVPPTFVGVPGAAPATGITGFPLPMAPPDA